MQVLRNDEHPFLVRFVVAAVAVGITFFALSVLGAVLKRLGDKTLFPIICMAISIGVLAYGLKKNPQSLPYSLILPVPLGLTMLNTLLFAGVVSRWPNWIIIFTWGIGIYFSPKVQRPWKFALYCLIIVLIGLTVFLSLPKYTYAQAKDIIAGELKVDAAQLGPGFGFLRITKHIGSWPSLFVNCSYLYDAKMGETVTTYAFDPVNGHWEEVLPPRPLETEKHEELDLVTEHWLELHNPRGIKTD